MAQTREGALKVAEQQRAKFGVDGNGKSNFHRLNGARGGSLSSSRGFADLAEVDPERHREISRKGAEASNKTQGKTRAHKDVPR